MFSIPPKARLPLPIAGISVSGGLFAYLVWRAGPNLLWQNLEKLGWGFTAVLALAGISHLAKTWAWQLTLGKDKEKVSFPRLVGLRLGAEAAGQLGILGQTFGDSIRVVQLSREISMGNSLASVALDRGFFVITAIIVIIAGILMGMPMLSGSHALPLYAGIFVFGAVALLLLALLTVRRRWPLYSGSARLLGRVPSLKGWVDREFDVIESMENAMFDFYHNAPKAFWASFSLNLTCQLLAVLEVCVILSLLGANIGFIGALTAEALTKLVNTIGSFNPGNIGTYEGGNMLIGKMFSLGSTTGLALALARRFRAFFWTLIGGVCLLALTGQKRRDTGSEGRKETAEKNPGVEPVPSSTLPSANEVAAAIFPTGLESNGGHFRCSLARVGTLPILLRTIFAAQKAGFTRIMVVADPVTKRKVRRELFFTGRLPEAVQWIEMNAGASLSQTLQVIANRVPSQRLVLMDGNTTYHPSLLRKAAEWNDKEAALALTSGGKLIGVYALPAEMVSHGTRYCPTGVETLEELDGSLRATDSVDCIEVPENLWQRVRNEEDRQSAERKLDRWLVKPTDGMYAQFNRKISIPISRQLIKLPITANMVSIFTLGVGAASAAFFALGGYWYTLLGAFLCLFASILDGSDGEVARLKCLESDFGCWLETVCDYLFYLFLFVGMTVGLWRSSGSKTYLIAGGLLLGGAIASFLATAWERRRLAPGRPEQLLGIWQKHADRRPSNSPLHLFRQMEFMIRRCFFPYALLGFALLGIMNVAFVLSVLGANLVWPVALYSSLAFAGGARSTMPSPATSA